MSDLMGEISRGISKLLGFSTSEKQPPQIKVTASSDAPDRIRKAVESPSLPPTTPEWQTRGREQMKAMYPTLVTPQPPTILEGPDKVGTNPANLIKAAQAAEKDLTAKK